MPPPAADHFRVARPIEATMRRKDYEKKGKASVPTDVIPNVLHAIPQTKERSVDIGTILMMFYGVFR